MESLSSVITNFIHSMEMNQYIFFGIGLIFLVLLIHLYSIKKEKKKLHTMINQHVEVFQKAFHNANDAMLILSDRYEILFFNPALLEVLDTEEKYLTKEIKKNVKLKIKRQWLTLVDFLTTQKEKLGNGVLTFPQALLQSAQVDEIKINLYIDTLEVSKNRYHYIITIQDLTSFQKSNEMRLQHQLTALPNQLKAQQELPMLFSKIHTEDNKIALVLLSLDNFSNVRSIIGFHQSNEIILKFSNYLSHIVSDMNLSVYHTFDNHFLLAVSNVASTQHVVDLVCTIQEELASFYKMKDINLHLTVSSGISVYPDSGSTRVLLDNAYKALDQAQKEGDNKIIVYDSEISKSKYDELKLYTDMQSGLSNGEFEVYYQPIVNTNNHEVVAAEALIRWIHPQLGFISPDIFIGLMEKTGFIVKLGQFILEEVLKQQKRWELFKFKDIEVSVNVSMIEIATGDFVDYVKSRLEHHQVSPEKIKFEITEGAAMIRESQTEKYFHKLKKLGVGISLDDFGTGYTSFSYLKKFPADILKIDKSLIDNILTNDEDQRIVHAMIELGHNLGMKVVVEGIETKSMVDILTAYKCDYMQGYYFSKPLPVFEFQKLLRDEKIEK